MCTNIIKRHNLPYTHSGLVRPHIHIRNPSLTLTTAADLIRSCLNTERRQLLHRYQSVGKLELHYKRGVRGTTDLSKHVAVGVKIACARPRLGGSEPSQHTLVVEPSQSVVAHAVWIAIVAADRVKDASVDAKEVTDKACHLVAVLPIRRCTDV
jgi:hypothetical protein